MKLLKEEGISALLDQISSFEEKLGKAKVQKIIKESPNVLLELLPDRYVLDLDALKEKPLEKWTSNSKSLVNKMKLSDLQKRLILQMDRAKGISIKQLEKYAEKNLKIKTKDKAKREELVRKRIGGSLGGLNKKFNSYKIAPLYIKEKDRYYIIPALKGKISDLFK